MNIETRIDSRLWQIIQSSYENRNYTGAILDAIYFLGDLIREKAGLESDGVTLVGKAFGGKTPKLKVNKLQSESDWNIQKGLEQILRGVYQSIRNPRSHKKYTDTAEDAQAIILFINYLIRIIEQSKTPFTKSAFLDRVFDPDFVTSDRYAELLVKEIPKNQRLEVFIEVYRKKETGDRYNLKFFVHALLKLLKQEEKSQVYGLVSDELNSTNDEDAIRHILKIFPSSCWEHYDEAGRLRIENKLIKDIKNGQYEKTTSRCIGGAGALGTWATNISEHFLLKDQLVSTLLFKLESPYRTHQDYVFTYFISDSFNLMDQPTQGLVRVFTKGLKNGDKRFYDAMRGQLLFGSKEWKKAFGELVENFVESEETIYIPEDDIPF